MDESKAIVVRPAEVLGPAETPAAETLIERIIEKKLAEMKEKSTAETLFEPFFRSKAIGDEIKRHQTIPEQQKWSLYYEKWGCLICETKDRLHVALGMCGPCYRRIHVRLKALLKEAESERQTRTVTDLTEKAQAAFCRSVIGEKCAHCGADAQPLNVNAAGHPIPGTEFLCPECGQRFPQGEGGETGGLCGECLRAEVRKAAGQ